MKKHIGSTIALVLGVISLISGLNKPSGLLVAGLVIILGALAYRSAKKRILGEVKTSLLRKGLEVVTIVIIVAAVLLQNDLTNRIITDPVPNLIIPLWAIIAYAIIVLKRKKNTKEVGEET
jgi:hypothetical protein